MEGEQQCIKCNIMKSFTEFRGSRSKCKKCENDESKARNKLSKERIAQKQRERRSTSEGKAKVKEYNDKYRTTEEGKEKYTLYNKEHYTTPEARETQKEYRNRPYVIEREKAYQTEYQPVYQKVRRSKPGYKEWLKQYKKNRRNDPFTREKVREQEAKYLHKRRGLGYIPINGFFKGSVRHHLHVNEYGDIDKDTVLRIPTPPHKSIHHDKNTGEGMIEINEFCLSWYIETYQKDKPYNDEVEINVFKLQKIVEFTKKEVESGWRNRTEQ